MTPDEFNKIATQVQLEIAERKLKKYEDNNIRAARDRKNNNVVKLSGRIPKERDQT